MALLPAAAGLAQDAPAAKPEPLPPLLRVAPDDNYQGQILRLEEAKAIAEAAAPEGGFLKGVSAWLRREPRVREVPIRRLLVAPRPEVQEASTKGEQFRLRGVVSPGDPDYLAALLAAYPEREGVLLQAISGLTRPALLKSPDDEPVLTPFAAMGIVQVTPEAEAERSPYTLLAREIAYDLGGIRFLIAHTYEVNGQRERAVEEYTAAFEKKLRSHPLAPEALYRGARLAEDLGGHRWEKRAGQVYMSMWQSYVQGAYQSGITHTVLVEGESSSGATPTPVAEAIGERLDAINRRNVLYKIMHAFALVCGGSGAWGVLLLALVTRAALYPLSKRQVKASREMQQLQPEVKKLQEKYKDDRQLMQRKMMELYKERGVNMFGGCLPLLLQMPILIALYMGIRMYIYQFSQETFLWIGKFPRVPWIGNNLAAPDMILLVAYTISMVVFQKITAKATPPTDPQQQQMQQTMAWMMPIMFFFIFQSFPSAFILYWLGTNVIYAGQQWWLTRALEAEARGPVVSLEPERGRGARTAESPANPGSRGEGETDGGREDDDAAEPPPQADEGPAPPPKKRRRRRRRKADKNPRSD